MTQAFDAKGAVDTLYMFSCTLLLFLVVFGLSLFYSGLIQRRSSFTMLAIPMFLAALVFVDWYIWGYSLCYGSSSNHFIGSLKFAVLREIRSTGQDIYSTPRGDILAVVHFLFNGMMKVITVVITFPACIAERGRILPMLVFLFFWSTIVYNPVTYWIWNRNGWLSTERNSIPVLDFAGGNCIHIVGGFTGLVYSYYLGPRNPKILENYRSSSNANMVIGTVFTVYGWCGFIAGCDFKFSATTFYIIINTLLCASCAGISWSFIDYYNSATPLDGNIHDGNSSNLTTADGHLVPVSKKRCMSIISFCSGLISGLVVFTPCGGYLSTDISFWKSIVCGLVGGITGNMATRVKYWLGIDDALDVFAVHGICGIVGSLLVGVFADDLYNSKGGWVTHHWVQMGYQVLAVVVVSAYVCVVSLFLLYVVDIIPGLHLRIDKDFNRRMMANQNSDTESGENKEYSTRYELAELMGTDWYEFRGEYTMDFMEFIRSLNPNDYVEEVESKEHSGYQAETLDSIQDLRKRLA